MALAFVERLIAWKTRGIHYNPIIIHPIIIRARRVADILAGFGDLSKKPADLGSSPSESVLLLISFI